MAEDCQEVISGASTTQTWVLRLMMMIHTVGLYSHKNNIYEVQILILSFEDNLV